MTTADDTRTVSTLGRTEAAVPHTLATTRERRGLTAKQVSEALGKSASYVSRAEAGSTNVSGDDLERYAAVLDVTPELLRTPLPIEPPEGVHFRSHAIPNKVRARVISHANYVAWLLNQIHLHVDIVADLPRQLPQIDVDLLDGGPEEAAQIVRHVWRLHGPISDIARLLEQTGIFIVTMPADIAKIDAITVRTEGSITAVILLADDRPEDRKRHTLAHELAHLVMDGASGARLGLKETEERADRFAGEFLAPYTDLREHLTGITPNQLSELQTLQAKWGVSLPAMIRRAYLHDDITESQYRYWFRVLNGRNLLRSNTSNAHAVRAVAIADFLHTVRELEYSASDIMSMTVTRPYELQEIFGHAWPYPALRPRLRSV